MPRISNLPKIILFRMICKLKKAPAVNKLMITIRLNKTKAKVKLKKLT